MKLNVYKLGPEVLLSDIAGFAEYNPDYGLPKLLGTIEVTEPKKLVTKEKKFFNNEWERRFVLDSHVPQNATNVRILYDIEE